MNAADAARKLGTMFRWTWDEVDAVRLAIDIAYKQGQSETFEACGVDPCDVLGPTDKELNNERKRTTR